MRECAVRRKSWSEGERERDQGETRRIRATWCSCPSCSKAGGAIYLFNNWDLVISRDLIPPVCPSQIKKRFSAKYYFTRVQLRNTQLVRETVFDFTCYMSPWLWSKKALILRAGVVKEKEFIYTRTKWSLFRFCPVFWSNCHSADTLERGV